jgi:alpha-L-fucosidase 2
MVEVFPALPNTWRDVSFHNLRAEGAFLISAEKKEGVVKSVDVVAEKGGTINLKLPEGKWSTSDGRILLDQINPNEFHFDLAPKEKIKLINLKL